MLYICKLLEQLKSGFKETINWSQYQTKVSTERRQNQYLDFLTDASYQGVNRNEMKHKEQVTILSSN